MARYFGKARLGIFTLAFSFLQLFSTIGCLGLAAGTTRNLAFYNGKKDNKLIPDIISSSILIIIISSSIIATILFIFSGYISENIFHEPSFKTPLMIFAIAIPINNIVTILISIFTGFKKIKPTVYFQQIFQNIIFFLLLILIIFANKSFIYVFYIYLFSLFLTFILLVIYTIKKMLNYNIFKNKKSKFSQAKPLLLFSLPLLTVAIVNSSTNWINTTMIAGFKTAADLGLYKAALIITGFIVTPFAILLALYTPVISDLYGSKKINEINRIYPLLTKWLCFFTFPIFLFIMLFSAQIINIMYGNEYIGAVNTLRILSIATIISNISGPNGSTLISIGKPKLILYSITAATITNIALNVVLIPQYGIEGAAIAITISFILFNIIKSSLLYFSIGTIPFNYNLIKPTILTIFIVSIIYIIIQNLFVIMYFIIPLFLVIFYLIYFASFVFTKSVENEDVEIITIISKKLNLKIDFLTNFMSKYKNQE